MNTNKIIIAATCLLMFCFGCKNENKQNQIMIEKTNFPEWAKSSIIYEVNIRQYTDEGTINAFSDHLPRLKELGVDVLWLMPVFPISKTNRKGTLGSYYAVSDFREVNPEFGTKQDLINLIDKAHAYGMKVVMDWVPNHTGWDHTWLKNNPEFYTKDSSGKVTDPLDDKGKSMGWTDVADLNYTNADMRKAMITDLLHWVVDHKIDGYRMDIAWGVPNDFWKTCSDTLFKANPNLFMIAEADIPEQVNEGYFHTCYGWKLHHILNAVAKGEKNVGHIMEWYDHERSKIKKGQIMHFITNHDENSWSGSEFERMGEGYKAFAALTMTFDGVPLLYSGQEEPLTKRLQFFEKDKIGFSAFKDQPFLESLTQFKRKHPALQNAFYGGDTHIIGKTDHVLAFKRAKDDDAVYTIFNLSSQIRKVKLSESLPSMRDVISLDIKPEFKAGEDIELKPWEFMLLERKQ